MVIHFEEFVEATNKAETIDELLSVFQKVVMQYGYDRIIFCLMTDHKNIGLEAGVGHWCNYPDDWMKFYFENGFDKLDPVITYSRQKYGSFTWTEIEQNLELTRKQKLCLNLGIESGLNNGICV